MAKKGGLGLGRGLDALMNTGGESASVDADVVSVSDIAVGAKLPEGIESDADGALWADVALLQPNPRQPRREFDQTLLEELASSIKEHGVVQPIIVEPAGEKNFFIIAGERRTRAAKLAGLQKVPVQIRRYNDQKSSKSRSSKIYSVPI